MAYLCNYNLFLVFSFIKSNYLCIIQNSKDNVSQDDFGTNPGT